MKFKIAGGVGEHGRNSFYFEGEKFSILFDAGIKNKTLLPDLSKKEIKKIKYVFLSHIHKDHSGALDLIFQNNRNCTLITSYETFKMLKKVYPTIYLEDIDEKVDGMKIQWGRSGHAKGAVYFNLEFENKKIFYSGDVNFQTKVYKYDLIENQKADFAIIDAAYGFNENSFEKQKEKLIKKIKEYLKITDKIFFPVPEYGRGLEILKILEENFDYKIYGDKKIRKAFSCGFNNFWQNEKVKLDLFPIKNKMKGFIFLQDPQLENKESYKTAIKIIENGGRGISTGTLEKKSKAMKLLNKNKMSQVIVPTHLNFNQYREILENNNFKMAIPFHTISFNCPKKFEI